MTVEKEFSSEYATARLPSRFLKAQLTQLDTPLRPGKAELMFRSKRARRRKKLAIGIGILVVALAVAGAIVTHTPKPSGISNFKNNTVATEAFIQSAKDVYKTRKAFLDYTRLTIVYLTTGYSLEEKWLFLHHFKNVGGAYVATMRELRVSDREIKEDLSQMLAQMSDASKKIKGQVIDIIPGFVSASSKWFQTLGLEKA